MNFKIGILVFAIFVSLLVACTKQWDDHYNVYPETVDKNIWDAMQSDPKISTFVQILKEHQADTLFQTDIPYTIFAPTNDAIAEYTSTNSITDVLLAYHIAPHFIQSGNIEGKRKVQTLTEKFALFEKYGKTVMIDGINADSEDRKSVV